MTTKAETAFMQRALTLAEKGRGRVSPNPMVGAVLVRGGKIIAEGYHEHFGGPHAEVRCLKGAKGDLSRATMYVTLEPCSHHGKTPPCVHAITAAGVGRVVVAMKDPNPQVAGEGIRQLRGAGIDVRIGLMADDAAALNKHFMRHIVRQRPYVHLKVAQSLDGFIGAPKGEWISSPESRKLVHKWRAEHDAILVGAGTVKADDPQLTVRGVKGQNPAAIIIDGALSVPATANVFQGGAGRRVIVCTTESAMERETALVRRLAARGIALLECAPDGRLSMEDVLTRLYKENIGSILVEGGSSIFSQFIGSDLVDELSIFVAPIVLGGGVPAFATKSAQTQKRELIAFRSITVGADVLLQAEMPEKR